MELPLAYTNDFGLLQHMHHLRVYNREHHRNTMSYRVQAITREDLRDPPNSPIQNSHDSSSTMKAILRLETSLFRLVCPTVLEIV